LAHHDALLIHLKLFRVVILTTAHQQRWLLYGSGRDDRHSQFCGTNQND
jgi:hypothetical protein